MFDQRRAERQEYAGERVEYSLDPFLKGGIYEAALVNVSETGICFLSSTPLTVGQQITLGDFMSLTAQTTVVMWVELCDEADHSSQPGNALFKIGVRFIGNNETAWEERQR
jgi:hypothetical protein